MVEKSSKDSVAKNWRRMTSVEGPLRVVNDLFWIALFFAAFGYMAFRERDVAATADGVALSLVEGTETRVVKRHDETLATIEQRTQRVGEQWEIEQRYRHREATIGTILIVLRTDLSLERFSVDADMSQVIALSGLRQWIPQHDSQNKLNAATISVRGHCDPALNRCRMRGNIGDESFRQSVTIGKGPVVASAIYPLLARGMLGTQVELSLFDPLSLQKRTMMLRIVGKETIVLARREHLSIKVEQTFSGILSKLWLDARGRVLKESFPFGFSTEIQ